MVILMSEETIKVKEIMSSPPITISPDGTVIDAAKIMAENNIGCIIVTEDNKAIGIVTRRDLVEKVLAKAKDPLKTKVREIMSSPLIYVEPNTPILEAARLMSKTNIRHLPVIDAKGVVGVISDRDILLVAPEYIELMMVRKGLMS